MADEIKVVEVVDETSQIPQSITWEKNHELIEKHYFDYLKENNKLPNYTHIARLTGLDRKTVTKHVKELNLDDYKPILKPMTGKILKKLAIEALRTGDHNKIKLFMQLVHNYEDIPEIQNNIQINVTYK